MLNNIQGIGSMFGGGPMQETQTLTDDQKTTIQDILSKYDPENLTAENAKSIFQAFKDAGIRPSKEVGDIVEAAGFDAKEMRELARPEKGGQPPGSPPTPNSIDVSDLQSLQSILSQYDLTNLSDADKEELTTKLQEAGLFNSGTIIDLSA